MVMCFFSQLGAIKNALQLDRDTNEDLIIADSVGMVHTTESGLSLSGIKVGVLRG